jgi:guanylate kinase
LNDSAARILILSGPSGAGKTTLANRLIASHPEIEFAVSHTTRAMRPGETDHVEYHFVSEDEFKQLVDGGEMLEYATVYGYHYGTSRQAVQHALDAGHRVLQYASARNIPRGGPYIHSAASRAGCRHTVAAS